MRALNYYEIAATLYRKIIDDKQGNTKNSLKSLRIVYERLFEIHQRLGNEDEAAKAELCLEKRRKTLKSKKGLKNYIRREVLLSINAKCKMPPA